MLGNGIFNGMYNPAAVWASDSSLYLDGVNDSAHLVGQESSFDNLVQTITVSMWVRLRPVESIVDTAFFQLWTRNNGTILFWYDVTDRIMKLERKDNNGANVQTTSATLENLRIQSQTHAHLAFRINASGMQIFINGSESTGLSGTIPQWLTGNLYHLYLGVQTDDGDNRVKLCNGWIHDIAIWNAYLDAETLVDIYNENEPSNILELNRSDLKYYHRFSEHHSPVDQAIATVNEISTNSLVLSGAIITPHDQIS